MTAKDIIKEALNGDEFPMTLANRVRRKGGIDNISESDAEKLVKEFKLVKPEKDAYQILKAKVEEAETWQKMRGELNETNDLFKATSGVSYHGDKEYYNRKIAECLAEIDRLKTAGYKAAKMYGEYIYQNIKSRVETVHMKEKR